MEGIGTRYYRTVQKRLFPEGIGRYYTPFLSVYPNRSFRKRDLREILRDESLCGASEPSASSELVPQILAGSSGEILWAVIYLYRLGFPEINLNMGCPSATVVKKGRGAGLLADPGALDRIFEEVFRGLEEAERDDGIRVRLSVKTRLGINDPAEIRELIPVFNRYPICEIILHPRVQYEAYDGTPHRDLFDWAAEHSVHPMAYNGDLFTYRDVMDFRRDHTEINHIMLGRGLIINPALPRTLAGGPDITPDELAVFIHALIDEYKNAGTSEHQILCKLKELWFYWGRLFDTQTPSREETKRLIHKIRISRTLNDYHNTERALLRHLS